MQVVDDERRNLIDFGSWGQRSRSTFALCVLNLVGTIQTTDFGRSPSNYICKLCMMRGGTLLILGHGVKGQGQLWHSLYKALWTQYRLQFMSNHFQTSHVVCRWWGKKPYWFWVTGQGQLCPPARGCHALFCPITVKLHMQVVDDEEEPYWFWVMGSKVKVNFRSLCIKPCGHDTDYRFWPITFKLHM